VSRSIDTKKIRSSFLTFSGSVTAPIVRFRPYR
jgi:hypothetical protein